MPNKNEGTEMFDAWAQDPNVGKKGLRPRGPEDKANTGEQKLVLHKMMESVELERAKEEKERNKKEDSDKEDQDNIIPFTNPKN